MTTDLSVAEQQSYGRLSVESITAALGHQKHFRRTNQDGFDSILAGAAGVSGLVATHLMKI
jgi:hypothetical protein